jgi:hypothetical protein
MHGTRYNVMTGQLWTRQKFLYRDFECAVYVLVVALRLFVSGFY